MFKIYIKDFNNSNGVLVTEETLVQQIPAKNQYDLKLIDPKIKNEMGSSETLSFSIEPGTKFYDAFLQMKTYMRITYEDDTIFYGRVLTISNNTFRGTRQIRMEGPLAFLTDSPVEGVEESKRSKITTFAYMQKLINDHNKYCASEPNKKFMLGNVPGNYSSVTEAQQIKNDTQSFGSDSWTDTKSALEDLRSHYGGYFRTRAAGKIGKGVYLDWMNHYFNSKKISQKIEVGKNVLDISNVTEINNIFTAIIPIGRHSVTSSSNTENSSSAGSSKMENLYLDERVIYVPDIIKKYSAGALNSGYHKYEDYRDAIKNYGIIIKPVTFQEANTKEKLKNEAYEWIKNNYQGGVTKFTIKAIDMHQIGDTKVSKIMIGDQVEIKYPVGNEKGTFKTKTVVLTCLSIDFDLYHPENNSYTFGIPANMLTKTYGVKRAGSVNSGITDPPKATPTIAPDREKPWIRLVGSWLMNHKLHYNGPMPFVEDAEHRSHMYAINPLDDQIYWPTKDMLYNAYIKNTNGEYASGSYKNFKSENPPRVFDEDTVDVYHVCEFVKYMYGIDLRTDLEVQAPDITIGSDGSISFWQRIKDAQDELIGKAKNIWIRFSDLLHTHKLDVLGPDGQEIYSYIDADGNWHYYYIDPKTGEKVETNIRDLDIRSINTDKKVGWIVGESDNPRDAFGQMTLGIENYAGGELVTARLSGELMYLGNYKTQEYTAVSLNHMDQICGQFNYVKDANGVDHVEVVSGGGMRVWHAELDENGHYVLDDENRIKYAEFGIYDGNTLTGGMITDHLADGTVRTKISGDIVDIDATQVKVGVKEDSSVATWLTEQGLSIDDVEGLLANRIIAYEGKFSTIETDYLQTKNLKAQVTTVSNGIGFDTFVVTNSTGYISSPAYRLTSGGPDYKDFTLNFGDTSKGGFSHKFLAQTFSPGPGVSNKYLNIGLRAEEMTGEDAGKIRISLYNGFTQDGGDGTGAAVFNIAATKKYMDGVAASWNDARMAMVIPTDAVNVGQLSDSAMNNLQIKKPKAYTTYNNSSGDNRYDLFNYKMEPGSFTRPNDSKAVPAIILKSLTSNSTVAALNLSSYLETVEETITTKAKTYTPSDGYIGIGSIKVTPTHSTPSGTAIDANTIKAIGISITADGKSATAKMEKGTFRPSGSTSDIGCINLSLGSTTIGRYEISTATILETRTETITTKAKTYTPSSGKLGISSIKVTPSHSAPSGSAIDANTIKATGISITADGKSATAKMEKGTFRPSGSTSDIGCINLILDSTTVGRYEVSTATILETRTETITTAAKTYTPSSGKLGISSIKVTPSHSAPSGSAIDANTIKATGISITADGKSATAKMEEETFRPSGSTSNVRGVKLTLGSTVIGRIDTNNYFTDGYSAGQASASSPSIDIPNNGFDIQGWEPSGTKLTLLKNAIMNAINYRMWLYFKVTAGNTSKQYYMDFT